MKSKKMAGSSKAKGAGKKAAARAAKKGPPGASRAAKAAAREKYSQPGAPWWKAYL